MLYIGASSCMAQISLQKLEADLASLTDNFANLVRSARLGDDSEEAKRPNVSTKAGLARTCLFLHAVNMARLCK